MRKHIALLFYWLLLIRIRKTATWIEKKKQYFCWGLQVLVSIIFPHHDYNNFLYSVIAFLPVVNRNFFFVNITTILVMLRYFLLLMSTLVTQGNFCNLSNFSIFSHFVECLEIKYVFFAKCIVFNDFVEKNSSITFFNTYSTWILTFLGNKWFVQLGSFLSLLFR